DELTPLHCASLDGNAEVAKLLAESGADLEARDLQQMTPHLGASRGGHLGTVMALVEAGADLALPPTTATQR
ncbi:hypothetical protein DFJ73DRAFT_635849, partial [Zopfochytrium polystomum]